MNTHSLPNSEFKNSGLDIHPQIGSSSVGNNPVHFAWIVIALTLGLFLVWSIIAPLDRGVVVDGTLVVEGNRKKIQHPEGGVIDQVLVKNGDWIRQGDILLQLDLRINQANMQSASFQYYTTLASIERLESELAGASELGFSSRLQILAKSDKDINSILNQQEHFWKKRIEHFNAEIELSEQKYRSNIIQARGVKAILQSHQERIDLYQKRIENLTQLNNNGYSSQHEIYELQTLMAKVHAEWASAFSQELSFQARASESELQTKQIRTQYFNEIAQQISDNQFHLPEQLSRYIAAEVRLEDGIIRSPVAGQVVGLNVFTQGQVIKAAENLMEIVPKGQRLVVEGRVPVDLIDSVTIGQQVDLLFTAFNLSQTPKVSGTVLSVASDRLVDEYSGEPYYQLSIELPTASDQPLAELLLQPGMPVQVFVKNGSRSMLSYLLKPLVDRIPQALAAD